VSVLTRSKRSYGAPSKNGGLLTLMTCGITSIVACVIFAEARCSRATCLISKLCTPTSSSRVGAQVSVLSLREQNEGKFVTCRSSYPQKSTPSTASIVVASGISTVNASPSFMLVGVASMVSHGTRGDSQSMNTDTPESYSGFESPLTTLTNLPIRLQVCSRPYWRSNGVALHREFA